MERGPEPNIFPGNWEVKTGRLLVAYDAALRQHWDLGSLDWSELEGRNFDARHRVALAYWFAKLAFFEKSGIGAFAAGARLFAEMQAETMIPKCLSSILFDQCRHDELCRRACAKLCPGFPYEYKPRDELERAALRNIEALYENGKRYWRGFISAMGRYRPEMLFSGFTMAEIGARLVFSEVRQKSRLRIAKEAFKNVATDENRHLIITLSLMRAAASSASDDERRSITRLLRQGFIFLSPLLYRPMEQFWRLPRDFVEVDQRLEELAYGAGLGVLSPEEKAEAWRRAVEGQRKEIEALGVGFPALPEVGVEGVEVKDTKGPVVGAL